MQNSIIVPNTTPKLLYAGCYTFKEDPPNGNPLHNHMEWVELELILEGSGNYFIDGRMVEVGAQSLVVFNQGIWHEERPHQNILHSMLYLGFSNFSLKGLPEGCFLDPVFTPVIPMGDYFPIISRRFREIIEEKNNPFPESEWIADHLLAILIAELIRIIHYKSMEPRKTRAAAHVVTRVKHFIQENYSRPITIQDMSKAAFLSQYHFSRIFKKETGISPIQHLIQYRTDVAKHYLKTTDYTNEKIAQLTGFYSKEHFQFSFKKAVGLTPGQFRLAMN